MLSDLDELLLLCRTQNAKTYLQEAIAAYRGSAYRASIVAIWIAVTFDLVDKLRELGISGDKRAKKIISDFEKSLALLDQGDLSAISTILSFERGLLVTARDEFQLFDQHQFVELQRIQDDRNRCAHPTYHGAESAYQPSAELVRTHIRSAVIHLLQQAPVQGKAAIDQISSTVASSYFPRKVDAAKALLLEGPFARPTAALVRGLVDRLLFGLFEPDSPHRRKLSTMLAISAVLELQRKDAEDRVKSQISKIAATLPDDDLDVFTAFVARVPEAWEGLSSPQQSKIKAFIATGPIKNVSRTLNLAIRSKGLHDEALSRVATMPPADLAAAIAVKPLRDYGPRVIELFAASANWDTALFNADNLVLPMIEFVTVEDIESIVRSPRQKGNDLKHSGGLQRVLDAVRARGTMPLADLDSLLASEGLDHFMAGKSKGLSSDEPDIPS